MEVLNYGKVKFFSAVCIHLLTGFWMHFWFSQFQVLVLLLKNKQQQKQKPPADFTPDKQVFQVFLYPAGRMGLCSICFSFLVLKGWRLTLGGLQ